MAAFDLVAAAQRFPDMNVTIRLGDLLKANEALVRKVRREVERELEDRKVEYGDTLIPRKEVVRMLGCNPSTLWRWEQEDYLHPVRIGTKVLYPKGELDSLLKSKSAKS